MTAFTLPILLLRTVAVTGVLKDDTQPLDKLLEAA